MTRFFIKLVLFVALVLIGYQYRYRLLNVILGVPLIRRVAVGKMLSFPGVRDKFMKEMF
ncbi:hypothetical protein GA0061096_2041 [Fictibacillus enclensis]|uniref:hypothetical protein n=1 Tax=Fictibacillus enclensis TaxID=1017270 RepID=UPI000815AF9B|nr:hypothetical protein [Fictibacillus enclensis]SCC01994.1 hypothetical protein GA0061096_2041 [Fictibacillus enclensis]